MNLRFLNRNNRCAMDGFVVGDEDNCFQRDDSSFPCFYKAFAFCTCNLWKLLDITYDLYIGDAGDPENDNMNNFNIFTREQQTYILEQIKSIVPVEYQLGESSIELDDAKYFRIRLHLVGSGMQHKTLLNMSRMLFEYPHNVCAFDAISLEHCVDTGMDITCWSFIQRYVMCLCSYNFSTDESLISYRNPILISDKKLKGLVANRCRKYCRNVFPRSHKEVDYDDVEFVDCASTTHELLSGENFVARVEVYKKNFHLHDWFS